MYCPTKKQQRNCYSTVIKDKEMLDIRWYSQSRGISWVLICSATAQGPLTVCVTVPLTCSNHLFTPNHVWMGSHGVSGPTEWRWRAYFAAFALASGKHDCQPQLFTDYRQVEPVSTSDWSRQHGVHKERHKEEVECRLQPPTATTRCSCTTGVLIENERGTLRWHSRARCNDRPFAELFVLAVMIRWLNLNENDHNLFSHHCLLGAEELSYKSDIWLEVVPLYWIWSQVRYHQRHNMMRYRLISYTPSQLRRAFEQILIDDDPVPCRFPCTLACEKQNSPLFETRNFHLHQDRSDNADAVRRAHTEPLTINLWKLSLPGNAGQKRQKLLTHSVGVKAERSLSA